MWFYCHMSNAPNAEGMPERIALMKKKRGCTDAHLFRAAGIGRWAYKARMRGEVPFTVPEAINLADALDVPLLYLLTGKQTVIDGVAA